MKYNARLYWSTDAIRNNLPSIDHNSQELVTEDKKEVELFFLKYPFQIGSVSISNGRLYGMIRIRSIEDLNDLI